MSNSVVALQVGVNEVILAVNVNPDQMMDFLKECEKKVQRNGLVLSLERLLLTFAGSTVQHQGSLLQGGCADGNRYLCICAA